MNPRWRILVFPGATEIGLEINRALGRCKEVELVSGSSVASCHADRVYRTHVHIPSVTTEGWLSALNEVIRENRVDYIFPAHDDVVVALANNAERIEAGIVSSPPDVCRLARSKRRTYEFLADTVPVPRLLDPPYDKVAFPVFVKPDQGQGSAGAQVVNSEDELRSALRVAGEAVVTEYLPGDEFTVDCFSDREAGLLLAEGRRRIRTRAGISMACEADADPQFRNFAERLNARINFHGAWFFQVKRDESGEFKLMEFAPRIAGAMAYNRVRGVNFPLLSIYEQERIPVQIPTPFPGVRLDRALANRYSHELEYETVYVDLDDTLVVRNELDTMLVRFLFQCVNQNKKIVLLTRHASDPATTLKRWRLTNLFDEVHHLGAEDLKSDFINPGAAVFIDDSHRERCEVAARRGIPTLDPNQVELLMDERN